ncbi:glycoside hydrolase/deacetylase [Jaminaea rosea]|uniref:chitin deacetylase n=1 Tax=Jaminaea rosea TaxID=1569628 RepID=A0A316UUW1_9BASI|nr:glycoside hydrolase/deacetylase [Jaminaea rosea]PWN29100.1 glycoside hydrolase/deacetylase [Jaminaea rosea]
MHFFTAASTAAAVVTFASSAIACGPGQSGHDLPNRRNLGMMHKKRAASTPTEESEGQIKSAKGQCTYYNVPEVAAIIPNYPTIWQTATIPSNDTTAQNLFNTIKKSIPSGISPKGTRAGDFTSVHYDSSDPDCWWTFGEAGQKCDVPKHDGLPADITICDEPSTWGLTFDDGPNCSHNAFYDYLLEKKQKATMFYIGSNVLDWPLQAQRGLVDGHHICSHTFSHPYMTALTDDQVFAELYYSSKAIKDVMGITVDCWRPPYGDIDDRVRAIATGLGLKSILWSADTTDWQVEPEGNKPRSAIENNYATIIANVSKTIGNIVLTHEINGDTMDIAMEQYPNISKAFNNVVPLTACMNWTNPYAEDITYPVFKDYVKGNIEPSGVPSPSAISISNAAYSPMNGGGSSAVEAAGSPTSASESNAAQAASSGSSSSGSSGAAGLAVPAFAFIGAVVMGGAAVLA